MNICYTPFTSEVVINHSEEVKWGVIAERNSDLIGYLCVGYVFEFLNVPELKNNGWEQQKNLKNLALYENISVE